MRVSRPIILAMFFVAAIGCHRVLIKIERRSSAGVPDTGGIHPRHFFDGHNVPLPAKPFVNCFDVVAAKLPTAVCDQKSTYPLRFAGYHYAQVPRPSFDVAPSWLRSTQEAVLRKDLDAIVAAFDRRNRPDRTPWIPAAIASVESSAWTDDTGAKRTFHFATLGEAPEGIATELLNEEMERAAAVRFKLPPNPTPYDGHLYLVGDGKRRDAKAVLIAESVALADGAAVAIEPRHGLPRPVFSFVHLSDAQIREPEATLGGQKVSDTLDPLIESFAHDYEQELFSSFFYEAIIRTINDEIVAARCDADPTAYVDGDAPAGSFGTCARPAASRAGARVAPTDDAAAGLATRGALYRIAPELAVHTGDSIDAGLVSEFREFLSRSDLLTIPWYSVVGNHDILGFGNLTLERHRDLYYEDRNNEKRHYACTPVHRMLREYYLDRPTENGQAGEDKVNTGKPRSRAFSFAPAALREVCLGLDVDGDQLLAVRDATSSRTGTSLFIEAHCRGSDLIRHAEETGSSRPGSLTDCGAHAPDERGGPPYAGNSRLNGYDLGPKTSAGSTPWPGYYAFEARKVRVGGKTRGLWFIVLNTSSEHGAYGEICPLEAPAHEKQHGESVCPQIKWLTDVLTNQMKPQDIAFVFGHHPIWGIEDPDDRRELKELLARSNVPAYFAGHTHSPQLRAVQSETDPDRRFWEVIAASTIAYPQQARQVTLKEIPGTNLAYLEVLTFEPHLEGVEQAYVERAKRGAERDACDQHPDECVEGKPRAPGAHVTYPRLFFRVTN